MGGTGSLYKTTSSILAGLWQAVDCMVFSAVCLLTSCHEDADGVHFCNTRFLCILPSLPSSISFFFEEKKKRKKILQHTWSLSMCAEGFKKKKKKKSSKKNKIDEGSHGKMHSAQTLSPADTEKLRAVITLINRHPG